MNRRMVSVSVLMLTLAAVAPADWHADTFAGKEFQNAGRYGDAEHMYRAAIGGAALAGPDALAIVLNNLGTVLRLQERYEEARTCYRRALQAWKEAGDNDIRQHVAGPRHPTVAGALNNLGAIFGVQRRYAQAEESYRRAAEIVESEIWGRGIHLWLRSCRTAPKLISCRKSTPRLRLFSAARTKYTKPLRRRTMPSWWR